MATKKDSPPAKKVSPKKAVSAGKKIVKKGLQTLKKDVKAVSRKIASKAKTPLGKVKKAAGKVKPSAGLNKAKKATAKIKETVSTQVKKQTGKAKATAKPIKKQVAKARAAAKKVVKNISKPSPAAKGISTQRKDTVDKGNVAFKENSAMGKDEGQASGGPSERPIASGYKPEHVTHGRDMHFIPGKQEQHFMKATDKVEAEKAFEHNEEIALHQEQQKVKNNLATRQKRPFVPRQS